MTTTVAVISDTHAFLDPRIIELVSECDIAVHAGDVCGVEVLDAMKPKSGKVYAVAGNNDPYCHMSDTPLPEVLSFDVNGEEVSIEHGHKHGSHKPDHESLRRSYPNSKIVIYGHTHKKVVDQSASPWVINPGAAGNTRTHGGPSCLIIECHEDAEWVVNKYRFSES